jgi:peptidoglycan L-alanyl-D-glutamate endopeptidase CwlK
MDNPTVQRIATLHPSVRAEVLQIITECNAALTGRSFVRITQGLRTFAEQDALYKQRPKVTNAKGGQSIHNYGFAFDICLIIDDKEASWNTEKDWDNDKISDWQEVVKICAKYGWNWGGNWHTFKDMPHFDKIGFNNWRQLINMKLGTDGYLIIPLQPK